MKPFKRAVSVLSSDANWNRGRVATCHALKAQMLTKLLTQVLVCPPPPLRRANQWSNKLLTDCGVHKAE